MSRARTTVAASRHFGATAAPRQIVAHHQPVVHVCIGTKQKLAASPAKLAIRQLRSQTYSGFAAHDLDTSGRVVMQKYGGAGHKSGSILQWAQGRSRLLTKPMRAFPV